MRIIKILIILLFCTSLIAENNSTLLFKILTEKATKDSLILENGKYKRFSLLFHNLRVTFTNDKEIAIYDSSVKSYIKYDYDFTKEEKDLIIKRFKTYE